MLCLPFWGGLGLPEEDYVPSAVPGPPIEEGVNGDAKLSYPHIIYPGRSCIARRMCSKILPQKCIGRPTPLQGAAYAHPLSP